MFVISHLNKLLQMIMVSYLVFTDSLFTNIFTVFLGKKVDSYSVYWIASWTVWFQAILPHNWETQGPVLYKHKRYKYMHFIVFRFVRNNAGEND